MSDTQSQTKKQENQAERLRHNLILRKKQIEEREKLAEKKRAEGDRDGK